MREAGVSTLARLRMAAFLMRAIMSPMGSLTILKPPSPARLHETRNLAGRAKIAQGDTAHLQFAVEGARTPRHRAAVADAAGGRVARQRRQLQPGVEALFQRQRLVLGGVLQGLPLGGELLDELADHFVTIDGALLGH